MAGGDKAFIWILAVIVFGSATCQGVRAWKDVQMEKIKHECESRLHTKGTGEE